MAKINVLDSSVFNKIAAGEVVERPASVVKEIVENSIDAGATQIQINIENGGINKIHIVDNGSGIEKQYIRTAFLPHATSKIKEAEDLFNISTLGFRGEALASICSVSNVSIISKTKDAEVATNLIISGGEIQNEKEVGAPDGTSLCIENLFFNVPARLKFLKKPKQEEQEITNLVSRIILANPTIKIKYSADGKEIYNSRGGGLEDAIFAIYGKEAVLNILPVNSKFTDMEISGFIGKPSYSKANRTYQTIIINGRTIENSLISLAVANAYGETLMKRQYPFFVLNIKMDNKAVDVNVHPSKKEVRFENSNKIFGAVFSATISALNATKDVKEVFEETSTSSATNTQQEQTFGIVQKVVSNPQNEQNLLKTQEILQNRNNFGNILQKNITFQSQASDVFVANSFEKKLEEFKDTTKFLPIVDDEETQSNIANQQEIDIVQTKKEQALPQAEQTTSEAFSLTQNAKQIGTLFDTYILVEKDSELLLIDQHAGHEKILFDKFMQNIQNKTLEIQGLLIPEFVKVNSIEKNYVEDHLEEIKELGFDITEFGENCYKISAVPLELSNINISTFWNEILSDLKDFSKKNINSFVKEKIASRACKNAVKAGDKLTEKEISLLLENLSNEKIALHCPHGRPIVIKISKTEIEKWFKRIV